MEQVVEPKPKRKYVRKPKPTEPVVEPTGVVSFKTTRPKKKVKALVIDPAFNEVEVECEILDDIDEIQMASLNGC
tara:strand:+ start:2082 stop:2306 length:225 start_codon:yes stop_codon:yes gene_type:complete